MRLFLVGSFLFGFLNSLPAHAVTIVDISEVSTIIAKEYINDKDCEWWEIIETRTTTTYREPISTDPGPAFNPGFLTSITHLPNNSFPQNAFPGFHHPCFPDPEDKGALIPDYCTNSPFLSDSGGGGYTFEGTTLPLTFYDRTEVAVRYSRVYHNTCHTCDHDPIIIPIENPIQTVVPEPQSWALGLTGLVGILLSRCRSRNQ